MVKLRKPNLRGFHNATVKRNLFGMAILVAIVGTTYHFVIKEPKKMVYAEFYKNYDAEAAAARMREAGLLQSMPPEPPKEQKIK